jgi:hypothetical protein
MFLPDPKLQERQSPHAPCPSGNGTTIGDQQKFVVYCNTRFQGDEIFRMRTDSLATCANIWYVVRPCRICPLPEPGIFAEQTCIRNID